MSTNKVVVDFLRLSVVQLLLLLLLLFLTKQETFNSSSSDRRVAIASINTYTYPVSCRFPVEIIWL